VYCHNCGNKLDRSTLAVQQQKVETPEQRRKRVHKLLNPNGWFSPWRFLRQGLKTVACAAVTAILIDAALPPDGVPAMPQTKVVVDAPDLGVVLDNLATARSGQKVLITENELNGYLKNTVRAKRDTSWLASFVEFERVFSNLEPGTLRLTVQNAVYGYSVYSGLTYKVAISNHKLAPTLAYSNFGRLRVPQELAVYTTVLFNSVKETLKRERDSLEKIAWAEVKKGEVILASPGTAEPGTSATASVADPARP